MGKSMINGFKNVYCGTSGLVIPITKKLFPEEFMDKSRLAYYASIFNSIEINSSFYKLPKITTVARWAQEVPENFRFTFKISKTITHNKGLVYDPADVDEFMSTIAHIGSKKGCLLIQFPPGLRADYFHKFEELLCRIRERDESNAWNIAVEFRHTSWFIAEVYEELKYYNASMVIQDIPATATPAGIRTSDIVYYRFHGPEGRYRGSYSDHYLDAIAKQVSKMKENRKEIYIYFNNTMGDAFRNVNTLKSLL